MPDELTDRVIDVLAEADIERSDKLRFDFMVSKDSLEMKRSGYSIARNKLIVLPAHFALKEENELTDELIAKLKASHPQLAKIDLSKLKPMFVLWSEELRFAMLCEIRKANWDYVIVDSVVIWLAGWAAMSIIYVINSFLLQNRVRVFNQYGIASLFSLVFLGLYFYFKERLYDDYVDNGLKDTTDLDLVEGGLHYLNKQIQLDKLLGKDTIGLERRSVKLKTIYENLKAAAKQKAEVPDSDEEDDSDEDDSDDEDERKVTEKKVIEKTKENAKHKEVNEIKSRLDQDKKDKREALI